MEESQYITEEGTALVVAIHRGDYIGGANYAGGDDVVSEFP